MSVTDLLTDRLETTSRRSVSGRANGRQWWVARTRARHELLLERALRRAGVDVLAPSALVQRDFAGTPVHVRLPFFPGYVLFSGGPLEVGVAQGTGWVVECREVPAEHRDELAREAREVARDAARLEDFSPCAPLDGTAVRVRVGDGPLSGLTGRVAPEALAAPGGTVTLVLQVTGLSAAVGTRVGRANLSVIR